MNADEKNRYFQELSRNLRHEGLTVKPETEEGLLPVELDGQRLCLALDSGAIGNLGFQCQPHIARVGKEPARHLKMINILDISLFHQWK